MAETGRPEGGVAIRKVLIFLVVFMLATSALLLVATERVSSLYAALNSNMESYRQWQRDASDLQVGSDYLTEQVRCFVVTGDRAYLDNYFEEAHVTRRRDRAVESVRRLAGETDAYTSLATAMDESVDLMSREYYAMRLAIAGYGMDVTEYPPEIQAVELTGEDLAKTPDEQRDTARQMVHDGIYRDKKQAISAGMQDCLAAIATQFEAGQGEAHERMQGMILVQRVLIGASIVTMTVTIALIMRMVILPLLKAVTYIRKDQSIPVEGSEEFRYLAHEYNVAHEAHTVQKQELAYEASHDILTGVYNRNGYDTVCKTVDWDDCALVLFDLDDFKGVNDTHGHMTGDRVLTRTARAIQNVFRAQDYVCRIGGDEFAVIMLTATVETADIIRTKVGRINEALSEEKDGVPGIHLSSGAAFGALVDDYDALFDAADTALYRVKSQGGCGCEVIC